MDSIRDIARKHNLRVIEDAAHAVGSEWNGQLLGTLSQATVFSFYATKNLTTAEGGMITTDDDDYADQMRIWVLHGMTRDAWKRYTSEGSWYYEVVVPGFKYNMMDIQAALGLHQLARFESMMQRRELLSARYTAGFGEVVELQLPVCRPGVRHSWHLYPIRLKLDKLHINRAEFIDALKSEGISTSVHFIPLHRHPYYRDKFNLKTSDFAVADAAYQQVISLPLYTRMTECDIDDVVSAVRKVIEKNRI
jgi:dTDP-4-amino-4,6-dideoxygalactose transaminase